MNEAINPTGQEPYDPIKQPPQSLDEAMAKVQAARALYEGIPTPETDLPDTPRLSFGEAVADRADKYWLDHDDLAGDISLKGLAQKIEAPTPELGLWAAEHSIRAQRVWAEEAAASIFAERHPDKLPEGVSTEEAKHRLGLDNRDDGLVSTMLGQVKVVIRDGKPVLEPNNFATLLIDVLDAVDQHHERRYKHYTVVAEHAPRIAAVLKAVSLLRPFVSQIDPNKPGGLGDAAMSIYLASLRGKNQVPK